MPAPKAPSIAPPIPGQAGKMAAGGNFFTSPGTPGGGAQTGGYNFALQNLSKALQASQNTTQAQQMQLQQQLQQNQGRVQQGLINRGLDNTTISQTMQQAPLQTYNLGMAQVGDLGAMRQMQAYGNLAQMAGQGGSAISAMNQPYSQTQYTQNLLRAMTQGQPQYSPAMPSDFQQAGGTAPQQGQQQGLYQGPGVAGQGQTPAQIAAMQAAQVQGLSGGPGGYAIGGGGSGNPLYDQAAGNQQFGNYQTMLDLATSLGANG